MKFTKIIKNKRNKFLSDLAKANKESFGNERMDCCSLNKNKNK